MFELLLLLLLCAEAVSQEISKIKWIQPAAISCRNTYPGTKINTYTVLEALNQTDTRKAKEGTQTKQMFIVLVYCKTKVGVRAGFQESG